MIYSWNTKNYSEELLGAGEVVQCIPGGVESLVDAQGVDWFAKQLPVVCLDTESGKMVVQRQAESGQYITIEIVQAAAPLIIKFLEGGTENSQTKVG